MLCMLLLYDQVCGMYGMIGYIYIYVLLQRHIIILLHCCGGDTPDLW